MRVELSKQLDVLPELIGSTHAELGDLATELARGGLRDSSIQRYLGAARSWKRYCLDRQEPFWNASTRTLLGWLDARCRGSRNPRAALKMGIAAARFLQRGYCVLHDLVAVPYNKSARVQLDAFARSATLQTRTERKVARPLRLDELDAVLQRMRADEPSRWGVSSAQGALLVERDIALLLVGWWGALRADDLSRIAWPGVHMLPCGIELELLSSKTANEKAVLALAARPDCRRLCPALAMRRLHDSLEATRAWRTSARANFFAADDLAFNLSTGDHVGRRIAVLFKRYGLAKGYTGHSLRAGFATECASQGIPDKLVQAHGRWRSAQQHAEYVRLARLWDDTPTKLVRLAV